MKKLIKSELIILDHKIILNLKKPLAINYCNSIYGISYILLNKFNINILQNEQYLLEKSSKKNVKNFELFIKNFLVLTKQEILDFNDNFLLQLLEKKNFKSIRLSKGYPSNGQKTRSNARTALVQKNLILNLKIKYKI